MRPANGRVSATALQSWEECPQKYVAQYVNYIPSSGSSVAADEGTALHYALEHFIHSVFIDKTHQWDDIKYLLKLYEDGWFSAFGTRLIDKDILKSAVKILKNWHKRMDFTDVQILSTEKKSFHDITDGIQLTYIFDRCDYYVDPDTGNKIIRVVDYKSVSMRWTHNDLRKKIQPLVYAVAAAIEYKNLSPDEIWVEMDLLRFDERIAIHFNRDDLIRGWNYLVLTVQDILGTDESKAPYRLGPGCRFCPRKLTCPALLDSTKLGGTAGNLAQMDIDEIIKLREELNAQNKGISQLLGQIDEQIFEYAKSNDVSSWSNDSFDVKLTSTGKRKITDMEIVARILGPEIMEQQGRINVTDIDKLKKDGKITEDQAAKVNTFIQKEYGAPSVSISKKLPFEN